MDIDEELAKLDINSKNFKFVEKILAKLGPNFARKSVLEKAQEAHIKCDASKQRYFESYILADVVMKAVNQQGPAKESCNRVHPFYLNTIKKYLPLDETSQELKLFGLTQKDIKEAKVTEEEGDAFKKQIEDNIKNFCIQLVEYTGGTVCSGDWKSALGKTVEDLESKVSLLSVAGKDESKKQLQDMIKTYYEEISNGISLLNKLLFLHVEKLDFESNVSEMYMLKNYALSLKWQVFQLKILLATYNQKTMPALKEINLQLDRKEETLKNEQREKNALLTNYLKLGDEYEKLVNEYMQITKSIEDEQSAIESLKCAKYQHEASNS